jgi:hypothetical protein
MMVSQSRHPGYQPVEKLRHGVNGSFGECCKPVCGHLEGQERADRHLISSRQDYLEAEGNVMSGAGVVSVVLPKRRQTAV